VHFGTVACIGLGSVAAAVGDVEVVVMFSPQLPAFVVRASASLI
jgi:hypothetical protein